MCFLQFPTTFKCYWNFNWFSVIQHQTRLRYTVQLSVRVLKDVKAFADALSPVKGDKFFLSSFNSFQIFCKVKINGDDIVNRIQDGPFWDCSWMGEGQKDPFPKICNTYPTLGSYTLPREDLKIYKSHDTL